MLFEQLESPGEIICSVSHDEWFTGAEQLAFELGHDLPDIVEVIGIF